MKNIILDTNNFTIEVTAEMDSVEFYKELKALWFFEADTYLKFPFPLLNWVEGGGEFKIAAAKPWGIKGIHNIKSGYVPVDDE